MLRESVESSKVAEAEIGANSNDSAVITETESENNPDYEPVAGEIVVCHSGEGGEQREEEEGGGGEELEWENENDEAHCVFLGNEFVIKTSRKDSGEGSGVKGSSNDSLLRGLLPAESDGWHSHVSDLPVVKRCCIEHGYFTKTRSETSRYNLQNLPVANEDNTLQFENENVIGEQLTIEGPRLEVNTTSPDEFIVEGVEPVGKNGKNYTSRENCRGSFNSDTGDFTVDDSNGGNRLPCGNTSDSVDESGGDVIFKQFLKKFDLRFDRSDIKIVKNVFDFDAHKKTIWNSNRLGKSNRQISGGSNADSGNTGNSSNNNIPRKKVQRHFVSVHDLILKVKKMQKLVESKYEKKFAGNTEKIPPPKLKRIMSRGGKEDFSKATDYFFPMPNLTKMATIKNSRIEDEVQSLGLDDLLLKASELNAENFTKALGRKLDSVKSNFNGGENSEIVLTIPKSKRNSADSTKQICETGTDPEFAKRINSKSVKLDFSKTFFDSSDPSKGETETFFQNGSRFHTEEPSPKKPGIKVKTVENINEEFKDSMESKRRVYKDVGSANFEKGRKDLCIFRSLSPANEQIVRTREKHRSDQEESVGGKKCRMEDDSRPFIMTIVQGKTEKQRPAILRNSSYFKKKSSVSESYKNCEKMGERIWDERESNSKRSAGSDSKNPEQNSKFQIETDSISGFFSKVSGETEDSLAGGGGGGDSVGKTRFSIKKKNIPFILNHNRKTRQSDLSVQGGPTGNQNSAKPVAPGVNKLVKTADGGGGGGGIEKIISSEKVFKVTSIEQKLGPKEANRRFIKVVPYEPASKLANMMESNNPEEPQPKNSDEESCKEPKGGSQVISLTAFSTILREILPDKWFLCLDKKYGLQIIKTQIDEVLNPSIMISVVIARCGKLTVNVRGKQLEKTHQLFANLCDISNSDNKLSLNYVLAILNKLRYLSVCFGCDPSLKKYLSEDGFVECQTQFQQVCRSRVCHSLVSLGKKRCHPCYRMNESLKKRHRRDKLEKKLQESGSGEKNPAGTRKHAGEKGTESGNVGKSGGSGNGGSGNGGSLASRGVKRNLEDFLEESFLTMKQQIVSEIEKNKKLGEKENDLKAQEEVLSFMGLTRKDNLGIPLRKSKRRKNSFYKSQQPSAVKKKIDQKELEFLEKYWADINTLFSTSLLFGAYSRTGRSRLREKCRMFHKLLSTWKDIVKSNPEWIGGEIFSPDDLATNGDESREKNSNLLADQFEKMDVTTLRAYIINSVKEVNRIKHKLRTRNSYFKILYNKFVKRRMKRASGSAGGIGSKSLESSSNATTPEKLDTTSSANNSRTNTPTDFSSDDSSSREKEKTTDEENHAPLDDGQPAVTSSGLDTEKV